MSISSRNNLRHCATAPIQLHGVHIYEWNLILGLELVQDCGKTNFESLCASVYVIKLIQSKFFYDSERALQTIGANRENFKGVSRCFPLEMTRR